MLSVNGYILTMIHEAIFSTHFIQWVARWPRYSQVGPDPEKFGNLCTKLFKGMIRSLATVAALNSFSNQKHEQKKTTEELIDDFNPFAVDQFANQPPAASQVRG